MLKQSLPIETDGSLEYFICGPEPMMDVVVTALLREGVPLRSLFSGRFNIV